MIRNEAFRKQSTQQTGFEKVTLVGRLLIEVQAHFSEPMGMLLGFRFDNSREVGGVGQRTWISEPSFIQSSHTHTCMHTLKHPHARTHTYTCTQQAKAKQTVIMPPH